MKSVYRGYINLYRERKIPIQIAVAQKNFQIPTIIFLYRQKGQNVFFRRLICYFASP